MTGRISKACAVPKVIDDANTGYDQSQRRTFLADWTNPQLTDIIPNKEADCSSVCFAIAAIAGYPVNLDDPMYTGTAKSRFVAAGFTAIPFKDLSQVRQGDFLLKPKHHIEFAYTATTFFSAHIDEKGNATGGMAGDQTGHEVSFGPAYNYKGGWEWILRPPADPPLVLGERVLKVGDHGEDVGDLQRRFNALPSDLPRLDDDDDYGPLTAGRTAEFQTQAGLPGTGVFDAATFAALLVAETPIVIPDPVPEPEPIPELEPEPVPDPTPEPTPEPEPEPVPEPEPEPTPVDPPHEGNTMPDETPIIPGLGWKPRAWLYILGLIISAFLAALGIGGGEHGILAAGAALGLTTVGVAAVNTPAGMKTRKAEVVSWLTSERCFWIYRGVFLLGTILAGFGVGSDEQWSTLLGAVAAIFGLSAANLRTSLVKAVNAPEVT
ncbi:MAG: peptidoglycan-binding protein [Sphaerochaeta sp.]|nr:peptidoglycan-binding protein [Sphaerochaeta sp.]